MKDISLHLLDIIQNSIVAFCTKITVSVNVDTRKDQLSVTVTDNGVGMDEELLAAVLDPFTTTRTTRKVGLGLPLLMDSARLAGGHLAVNSQKNVGTEVKASFQITHIDRIPLGDLAETLVMVLMANPEMEIELILSNKEENFRFNSFEVRDQLGDVPITSFTVVEWIRDYINEGVKLIFGGVLNEVAS